MVDGVRDMREIYAAGGAIPILFQAAAAIEIPMEIPMGEKKELSDEASKW
jgi:hypothetical protein